MAREAFRRENVPAAGARGFQPSDGRRKMRPMKKLLRVAIVVGLSSASGLAQSRGPAGAVVYEGARLIIGNGSAIEGGALVVENGRITSAGRKGAVRVPAGAARVDLTG